MVAGKDSFKPGEAKNSWLTGTAAWNYYAITQFILGIKPDYEGLVIDPCIPAGWKKFQVTRKFRDATYHIEIKNEGVMKGVKKLVVNGREVAGNTIQKQPAGTINEVEVILG
jgi:cellobiose phosphorylase